MLATQIVRFGLLFLLLQGSLGLLLLLRLPSLVGGCLLGGDDLVLGVGDVVRPPAGWTQPVQVDLDVVVAELAYLRRLHVRCFDFFSLGRDKRT